MRLLQHIPGLLAIAFISFFCYYDLGAFSIFQWDEARYANNSLEIATGSHWLYFTMDGQIDTWNFKPPLVLWMQALSLKVFGFNEWAVRFPSALAAVGIAILLYWFGTTALLSRTIGTASVLFFGASCGFISPHIARTADLDAVQAFFTIWYILYFFKYLLGAPEHRYFFARLALLVVLAFLCKGMPGLLPLPYLAVIAFFYGNARKVYTRPSLYWYAAGAMGICILYYGLREWNFPGYWEMVKKSEFNRFSGKGIEWHIQPFDFYWKNFILQKRYFFLIYLLPLTAGFLFISNQKLLPNALAKGHAPPNLVTPEHNPVKWTQLSIIKRAYIYTTFVAICYFLFRAC